MRKGPTSLWIAVALGVALASAAQGGAAQGASGGHLSTNPDWAAKPSADSVQRFYPARAQRRNIAGRSQIRCQVTASGQAAHCVVQSEAPTGYGFGDAALRLSSQFRFRPATIDGQP